MDINHCTPAALLAEYQEANSNLRHYSSMRFERLNVFLVANGALSWAQLFKEPPRGLDWFLPIVGVLVVLIFWLMIHRAESYYRRIRQHAVMLEQQLGFGQITNLPSRKIFSTRNATHLLFFSFFLLWAFLFVWASA